MSSIAAAQKSKFLSPKTITIITIMALMAFGVAAWFGYNTYKSSSDDSVKALSTTSMPSFLSMEPLIVNLADKDGDRYLQITIVVETSNEDIRAGLQKIEPMLRSRAMLVLTSKESTELKTAQGKQNLRNELMDLIQVSMADTGISKNPANIKDVHFSTFVIQ